MNSLLAVLDFTDFPVIAIIVAILLVTVSLAKRHRLNLHRIERKLDALLQHHGVQTPCSLSPEVQRLARDPSQKIAAIKLHREQTGASLTEAKSAVEDFSG